MAQSEKKRGFFRTAMDRLVEARTRQARAYIAAHVYLHDEDPFTMRDGRK